MRKIRDVEESGRGLFQSTIPAFTQKDYGKPQTCERMAKI
jgi:hypothetical protein